MRKYLFASIATMAIAFNAKAGEIKVFPEVTTPGNTVKVTCENITGVDSFHVSSIDEGVTLFSSTQPNWEYVTQPIMKTSEFSVVFFKDGSSTGAYNFTVTVYPTGVAAMSAVATKESINVQIANLNGQIVGSYVVQPGQQPVRTDFQNGQPYVIKAVTNTGQIFSDKICILK